MAENTLCGRLSDFTVSRCSPVDVCRAGIVAGLLLDISAEQTSSGHALSHARRRRKRPCGQLRRNRAGSASNAWHLIVTDSSNGQMLGFHGEWSSFVQTRGSVPLYWGQTTTSFKYNPSAHFTHSVEETVRFEVSSLWRLEPTVPYRRSLSKSTLHESSRVITNSCLSTCWTAKGMSLN